jgi:hypothetical protein
MIYIDKSQTTATVLVPTNGHALPSTQETPALVVRSTSENRELELQGEWSYPSTEFASLSLTIPEGLSAGEWEYTYKAIASEGSRILSTGILQVVEEEGETKQYNQPISYKQYGE